jgi:CRP-like cAMP-binding protein
MERLYETLLQLPFFQGITLYNFNELIGKLKWHFDKYQPGDTIIQSGDTCEKVMCILSGETSFTIDSSRKLYSVTEYTSQPYIAEPYSLFGLSNRYRGTYTAETEVTVGSFPKLSYLTIVNDFVICRLNILNLLSNRSQTIYNKLWDDDANNDFQAKVIRFFLLHVENATGKKIFKIKMYDLANIIDISHVNISLALNQLRDEGLIQLGRMNIIIPDISKLAQKLER